MIVDNGELRQQLAAKLKWMSNDKMSSLKKSLNRKHVNGVTILSQVLII